MNPVIIAVLVMLVVAAIVFAAIGAAARNSERLAALASWAAANGFQFSEGDPYNLDGRFNNIADIGRGHARYAYEVLSRSDPVPIWMFRYQYRTWETRTVTDSNGNSHTETYEETHYRSYLIIELQAAFPKLFIRPENFFDKMAGFVGFDDINFESEEFSRRFYCKSDNREFAYAVIHPQMMEWMLSLGAAHLRFEGQLGDGLFISDTTKLPERPEAKQAALAMAAGFVNRIPPFVWQDYGKRDAVKFPELNAPTAQGSFVAAGDSQRDLSRVKQV
jgi:hypothetical protein